MNHDISVPTATRTLSAAGFVISDVTRHRSHIEYKCERDDVFGTPIRYLIAISSTDEPSPDTAFARTEAERNNLTVLLIARTGGSNWLGWDEFLGLLGGPVPSWRALDETYPAALRTLSRDELPPGFEGEAWRHFESAVADGLEFVFGRRVKRMGALKRFKPLPDMLALTPDELLLVVDVKAAGSGIYHLQRPNLRPLKEYVDRQRARQNGDVSVGCAMIVAGAFEPCGSIDDICNEFLADNKIPLALLEVETLLHATSQMRDDPTLRPRIRWRQLISRIGLIQKGTVIQEIDAARTETYRRDLTS